MSELVISTGRKTRLVVKTCETGAGCRLVGVAPMYRDRAGAYRLAHSGLLLTPEVARDLAPAILEMAASIEGATNEPSPTEEDRADSRWP